MPENIQIHTGDRQFDSFYSRVKKFLEKDILDVIIDGELIRGYRSPDARSIWIRDYSDMMRGFKYFEDDLKSTVQHFADTQSANGRIFDYFTTFPEKLPSERENWTKYVRVPAEADVEFRFVKAAYLAWQTTGDDDWLQKLMPNLERALQYILNHPWRWDKKTGLVKRPYTIDTWDFAYTAGHHDWLQFQIDENTFWGIMHGDNSGYFEGFRIMADLYRYFGNEDQADCWIERSETLKEAMNRVCWNGSFYTHFVKLSDVEIPGMDEDRQLSLSNPMNINRGIADHQQAVSILKEYQQRKHETGAFAEWFSIDPPFPDGIFGDEKLKQGAYVNGGIMPLVGGELARAAFEHGFESYGVETLRQYMDMIESSGKTYLWYHPDGTPAGIETSTSPDAEPTDGWGSSAMLYAFIEGLAGIQDKTTLFREVRCAPRWLAAGVDRAEVQVGYRASGAGFGYTYEARRDGATIKTEASGNQIDFHVLIPSDRDCEFVLMNGKGIPFRIDMIENSRYVDFHSQVTGGSEFRIEFLDK